MGSGKLLPSLHLCFPICAWGPGDQAVFRLGRLEVASLHSAARFACLPHSTLPLGLALPWPCSPSPCCPRTWLPFLREFVGVRGRSPVHPRCVWLVARPVAPCGRGFVYVKFVCTSPCVGLQVKCWRSDGMPLPSEPGDPKGRAVSAAPLWRGPEGEEGLLPSNSSRSRPLTPQDSGLQNALFAPPRIVSFYC